MIGECARELEILEAVAFGRWPGQCPELVAHAALCDVCADLVDVAQALHDDRAALCREAQLPSAGIVWWRATIRARADAARTVTQPISVLQGIAGATIVGAVAGLATVAWRSMDWIGRIGDIAVQLESHGAGISAVSTIALPVLLTVAAGLVLAPLALYLTLADD
jgi:hypothetical protein